MTSHFHVLKFLWCTKGIYFDREYNSGSTKAILASLKTSASIWKLECSSRTLSVRHVLQKLELPCKLDSFGTEMFVLLRDWQVGNQLVFPFHWTNNSKYNKNHQKVIFNWAAKGLSFLRGGGGYTHSGYYKTLSPTIACDRISCETET